VNIAHLITRLIVGGAQENTLLTCEDQHRDERDEVTLITGPGLGPEGSLEGRATENGIELRVIPELRRNVNPFRDWSSYRRIIAILRDLRPDILHTHSSKAGILGRAAASKLGIPVVHTVHGAAFHYGQNAVLKRIYIAAEKWAGKRNDHFISVADAMTDQYVAAGIAAREKFTTIHSGMDVEPFLSPLRSRMEVRHELGIAADDIVVGKIARLFPLKGHEFLIAAAARIVEANPAVRFLLIGDGILREQYERDIAAAGLTDRFLFTGLVSPERIPELIGAMDIVAHCSLWEGLARVLPQALIAGKPVVSYDVDGAREVVIPNETGYLLPSQSIDGLTTSIIELAGDAGLRERLGATGRERFTEPFRHQTMTRRIREVYERVLVSRQTSSSRLS
jgi:glycosyltransferase involved in cell wall biosynthesis